MSLRLFRPENRLALENLLTPGQEAEPEVGVRLLDDGVEAAKEVTVGRRRRARFRQALGGRVRPEQRVQDRLVVLVHEDRGPLPAPLVEDFEDPEQALGRRVIAGPNPVRPLHAVEQRGHLLLQIPRFVEIAAAEAQPNDRMADRPVPAVVDREAAEERLVPLEEFLHRVEQQALAEPPRPGKEVVAALIQQPLDPGGLVHVVAVRLPDFSEGLDPDGEPAPRHAGTLPESFPGTPPRA